MTKTARLLLSALVVTGWALMARPCRASGFLIYDISGQAIARASAVSADSEEPAAVWFNPDRLPRPSDEEGIGEIATLRPASEVARVLLERVA